MAISNFQDVVVLSSDTLHAGIEQLVLGSDTGSKSIVFAQDPALASALHLVASNPTAARTIVFPDTNGTVGLISAFSASNGAASNGLVVFSSANEFSVGMNGSTVTANMTRISFLEIGALAQSGTSGLSASFSSSILSSVHTFSSSRSFSASAIRVSVPYPINVTHIDPKGLLVFRISTPAPGGSVSMSATAKWWCGLYTINGSTAGVVSSTSNSTLASFSSSATFTTGAFFSTQVTIDPRFTNMTWNVTPGDYMFLTGSSFTVSCSINGNTTNASFSALMASTMYGVAGQAEVSYSVPYFKNGTVSASQATYTLSQINNSGGTGVTSACPFVVMIGS